MVASATLAQLVEQCFRKAKVPGSTPGSGSMKQDALYCVGQKAFIEKDEKVLILMDPKSGLDFPGGKVQEGELDFDEELRREVREETGFEIEIGAPFVRWYFEFSEGHRNVGKKVFLLGFRCKYRSGELVLSAEHNAYHWVDRDTYQQYNDGSGHYKALEKYFT